MYPEPVINYIAGDCIPEEEKFVKEWVAESPERREEIKKLKNLWKATSELELESNVDRVWERLALKMGEGATHSKMSKPGREPIKRSSRNFKAVLLRVAAVVLIAVGALGIYEFTNPVPRTEQQDAVYHTLTSEEGQQIHYRFKDGSKVVLNSGSQVRYRGDFGDGTRTLHLKGEAYFEVTHDHKYPFIVVAQNVQVKDIGTKFNINSYPESDKTEVVVAEGSVEVSDLKEEPVGNSVSSSRSVLLKQGEKVEVSPGADKFVIEKADLHEALSWVNNHLVFDKELFRDVVKQLEEHYDIRIKVKAEELLNKRVTASFQGESVQNVLDVLSLSMGVQYKLKNRGVIFYQDQ